MGSGTSGRTAGPGGPPCVNDDDDDERKTEVLAAVEIKTRFATGRRDDAVAAIAASKGSTFCCAEGDATMWQAVPTDNRAQILHDCSFSASSRAIAAHSS